MAKRACSYFIFKVIRLTHADLSRAGLSLQGQETCRLADLKEKPEPLNSSPSFAVRLSYCLSLGEMEEGGGWPIVMLDDCPPHRYMKAGRRLLCPNPTAVSFKVEPLGHSLFF